MQSSLSGKLAVKGIFKASFEHSDRTYEGNVTVVLDKLNNHLLSHSVSEGLGFVSREAAAEEVSISFLRVVPVKKELAEGAEPYAVHTTRNVGFNLLSYVKEELKLLEHDGNML